MKSLGIPFKLFTSVTGENLSEINLLTNFSGRKGTISIATFTKESKVLSTTIPFKFLRLLLLAALKQNTPPRLCPSKIIFWVFSIIDLFYEPELAPPDENPDKQFTRANHLAFNIAPELFDRVVAILQENEIAIASGPVTRPTGRGVYFYDPDGFMIEIRCAPLIEEREVRNEG